MATDPGQYIVEQGGIRGLQHQDFRHTDDENATSQATKLSQARFRGVVIASSNPALEAKPSAFKVESPRASDAIGKALRDTYAREMGLPEDMAAMLLQLNGHDSLKPC